MIEESKMIDTHDVPVEIKVTADPNGGLRIWVHADGQLALRAFQATLHLDGLALTSQEQTATTATE